MQAKILVFRCVLVYREIDFLQPYEMLLQSRNNMVEDNWWRFCSTAPPMEKLRIIVIEM